MMAINKRRLLKLAEFLETAELPGEFDMGTWGQVDFSDADKFNIAAPVCRTSACALGWATTIPAFRQAGLIGIFDDSDGSMIIEFEGCEGVSAAAEFFCLTDEDATSIFSPDDSHSKALSGKRGRNTVAKRIRELVECA